MKETEKQVYSGIGGQAVMEGIMMRNQDRYAVAVRKPDGDIIVREEPCRMFSDTHAWAALPFIRGVFSFIDSLKIGLSSLMWSASFEEAGDIEDGQKEKNEDSGALSKGETLVTVLVAAVLAVGLFSALPAFLAGLIGKAIKSYTLQAVIEGIIRVALFIAYVGGISMMKDIRRVYMYHGSEHKCINCIEHGLPLTVDNVMASSKEHKRCGTSFLLIIMLISIVLFMFIRVRSIPLRILSRILLIPVVASVSYEILRFNGKVDNKLTAILSKPGLWMQALTTREPDRDMVEVAIRAVEQVFDWRAFLKDNFTDDVQATGQ